jgi:DNA-binding winged helix-turn-helix (wHTH) protein
MRLHFGDYRLDTEARSLFRSDQVIHLTPKAFGLLALLVESRPKALSKPDLLRALWPDSFVSEGSLANLVTEVRTALGEGARASRYIRTVHRFGYAFSEEAWEDLAYAVTLERRASLRLVLPEGELELLEGENRIGRARDCRVRLDSASVSRYHARILVAAGEATIEDLGSKNGTSVGEVRLLAPRRLTDGDSIRVGAIAMSFRFVNPDSSTATLTLRPKA